MEAIIEQRVQASLIKKMSLEESRISNLYSIKEKSIYMSGIQKGIALIHEVIQEEEAMQYKSAK